MCKALQHLLRALSIRLWIFELEHPALRVTLGDVVDELQEQGRWQCADVLETTTKWGCPLGAHIRLTQRFGGVERGSLGLCVGLDQELKEQPQVRLVILFGSGDRSQPPTKWWHSSHEREPSLWDADTANFVKSAAVREQARQEQAVGKEDATIIVYLTRSQWKSKAQLHSMPQVHFHASSGPDAEPGAFDQFESHPQEWPWNAMP